MMYIEQTPLKRQEILRNHVQDSTTAILLANVRQQNGSTLETHGESYFRGETEHHPHKNNIVEFSGKRSPVITNKSVNVLTSAAPTTVATCVNGTGAHSAINIEPETDNVDVGAYELLEVDDNEEINESNIIIEQKQEQPKHHQQQQEPNQTQQQHNQTSNNQQSEIVFEFQDGENTVEYIIVPKNSHCNKKNNEYLANAIENFELPSVKKSSRRPIPDAIPIENSQNFGINNNRRCQAIHTETSNRTGEGRLLNGCCPWCKQNYITDSSDCCLPSHIEEGEEEQEAGASDIAKDIQMDLLNKLRKLIHLNSNKFDTEERTRKRKPLEAAANPHHIKYRRVECNFPDYIAPRSEYAIEELMPTTHHCKQQQKNLSNTYFYMNSERNMPQRRSLGTIDVESSKLRKSLFVPPQTTQTFSKNESYADFEFSDDDDEPQLIRGFGVGGSNTTIAPETSRLAQQTIRLPSLQSGDVSMHGISKSLSPPPLLEAPNGYLAAMMGKPNMLHKPSYAEALKQNLHAATAFAVPKIPTRTVNENNVKHAHSSSGSSTGGGASMREFMGYSQRMPQHNVHSILLQEHEIEERDKYQQLLEQMVPRLYGGNANKVQPNKKSNFVDLTQTRSALHSNLAIDSSVLSATKYKNAQILKRPPLSSTINLDDDDNELSSTTRQHDMRGVTLPTIILDDDISDIIDLAEGDNDHHHNVRKSCSSKHKENSALNLNAMGGTNKSKTQKDKLPYVEPVNSVKDRIKASPHSQDNWLQCWQSNWDRKHKSRQQEVTEALKQVEKLSFERKAAETEIQENLRKFQIVDPDILVIDDFLEPVVEEEPDVIEFNDQQRARIHGAIYGNENQVVASKFGLNLTRRDIATLLDHNWLNDEVINFYMNLLMERSEKKHESHGLPTVYAMNTFFLPRLVQGGYSGVRRWTRKVDIFTKDIIPVPVHVSNVHWCMAIIHLRDRTIKYYDSMGAPNPTVLKLLEQYLRDESLEKRKQPFDTSQFEIESVRDVPRQMNGSDCGVFSCMFAEYVTRNRPITFSQANMEYFRQKMILEIVQGELMR